MANYNNGRYIDDAVKSVKNQKYSDWELIIVDDCSTDNSKEVLRKYSQIDNRIKVHFNEKNRGCGFTKNKAVKLCSGEYIIFLDPDDTLASTALEELLVIHHKNSNCSIAYATNYICDEYLNIIEISKYPGQISPRDTHMGIKSNKISHPALFKKNDYDKTSGINCLLERAVDQDLYAKLEEFGVVVFLNKPLHYYRQHSGSISLFENNIKAQYWNMIVAEDTYRRRKHNPSPFVRNIKVSELNSIKFYYHNREVHHLLANKQYLNMLKHLFQCFFLFNSKTSNTLFGTLKFIVSKIRK